MAQLPTWYTPYGTVTNTIPTQASMPQEIAAQATDPNSRFQLHQPDKQQGDTRASMKAAIAMLQGLYTYLHRQQVDFPDQSNSHLQNSGLQFTPGVNGGSPQINTPPTAGGTGTQSTFNQGSMVFAGQNGIYQQDAGVSYTAASQTLNATNLNAGGVTLSGGAITGGSVSTGPISGSSISGSSLSISGSGTFGSLHVTGTSALDGTVTAGSALGVTGALTASSTLHVVGLTTLDSTADIAGKTRIKTGGTFQTSSYALAVQDTSQATVALELRNSSSSGATQIGLLQADTTNLELIDSMAGDILLATGSAAGTTQENFRLSALGRIRIQLGSSGPNSFQGVMGLANLATSDAGIGNSAGGADTQLFGYTVPASTMQQNADSMHMACWGTFAADANNKTVKLRVGGNTIVSKVFTGGGVGWYATMDIIRVSATRVTCGGHITTGTPDAVAGGQTVTVAGLGANTCVIEVTGAATNANEILANGFTVWNIPVYA